MKPGTNSLKYKKDKQTLSYTYKKNNMKTKRARDDEGKIIIDSLRHTKDLKTLL